MIRFLKDLNSDSYAFKNREISISKLLIKSKNFYIIHFALLLFFLQWPSHFIVVAGINSLSRFVAQRKVTNIFAHRYCGGRPRVVDLGLVKVDHPWDPTPE